MNVIRERMPLPTEHCVHYTNLDADIPIKNRGMLRECQTVNRQASVPPIRETNDLRPSAGTAMDVIAITVGIGWTIAGLLGIALSIPLIRGRVGRNAFYGVRFKQSFQSDEAWIAINRHGGMRLALWSMPLVVTGLVTFFLPLQSNPGLALVIGFAPLIFVLIPVIETWRFAWRYRATE